MQAYLQSSQEKKSGELAPLLEFDRATRLSTADQAGDAASIE
jgi:hypothetical protein